MKPQTLKFSFLMITLIATLALLATGFDAQQHVDAQSATQVATSPAASGNGKLIFVDPQKLVGTNAPYYGYTILDPDTQASQQITLPSALRINGLAVLSPDGKLVAFSAINFKGDQIYNVYVMNINGSNLRQLTKDSRGKTVAGNGVPIWSPDGKQLLFLHVETDISVQPPQDKTPQILVMNTDGTGTPQAIQPDSPVTFNLNYVPVWSPDGKHILFVAAPKANAAPSDTQVLLIMDTDGKNTAPFKQDGLDPAWSSDGKQIAFITDGGHGITITDADGSNPRKIAMPSDLNFATNVAWSPDGAQLAFGGQDEKAQNHIYVMNTDGSNVKAVANAGDSSVLVSGWGLIPADALIAAPPQGTPTKTLVPSKTPIPSKTPKPSATPKTTATAVTAASSLTPLTLTALKPIEFTDVINPNSADLSPDQRYVAAALQGIVKMWDATTGTLIRTFEGGTNIGMVRFSPDGKYLLGHDNGTQRGAPTPIYVWETATGKQLYTVQDGGANPVFSPDSKLLMSIGPEPQSGPFKIQIWDATTGANKTTFAFKNGLALTNPLEFSPDGKSVLIVSPFTVSIVDSAKGTVKATVPPATTVTGEGQWLAATWSPDGTSVLVGEDTIPVLYDAKTLKEIRRFDNTQADAHSNLTSMNFSADGKYALTFSSNEFAARLWDVQTGKLIKAFNDDKYLGALLSPDGKFVLLIPLSQKPLQLVSSGL